MHRQGKGFECICHRRMRESSSLFANRSRGGGRRGSRGSRGSRGTWYLFMLVLFSFSVVVVVVVVGPFFGVARVFVRR